MKYTIEIDDCPACGTQHWYVYKNGGLEASFRSKSEAEAYIDQQEALCNERK